MQHDIDTVLGWRKRKVIDRDGEKIGRFEEIYLSGGNQRPEWAAVSTGLFGLKHSLVPLHEAQEVGDEIQVPLQVAQVKDAPRIDPDGELSSDEEQRLYSHYGLQQSGGSDAGGGGADVAAGAQGRESGGRAEGAGADRQGGARDEALGAGGDGGTHDPRSDRAGTAEDDPARHGREGAGVGGSGSAGGSGGEHDRGERGEARRGDDQEDRGGDQEEGGGRTRRHVVTEEIHRNVRTEETESDR